MVRRLITNDAVTQFYDLSRFITAITLSDASPRRRRLSGLSVSPLIFLRIMTYRARASGRVSFVRARPRVLQETFLSPFLSFLDPLAEWTVVARSVVD